ncbi:DUF2529 domain-containing protein [Bacillus sp. EB106-08-02-XG196]|uniref:DUF2529 family protein n=1 Tax=Bacillus sp. EB106-08-02-XG196 TaxID=2737049 RepID=UPI0015C41B09|nr:DUF2529 family protein [Bacillus sp. EB106-08-02-XG196]NWQ40949.1 DUF2529 domain-containing protein [Bacillus sp. EB106-08-02-XG196]
MMKMFTTQLTGLFKRIEEKAEFSFEDGARLLAQGQTIYLVGFREMKAVEFEVSEGAEPLKGALTNVDAATSADRVLLFTRTSADGDALELAAKLLEKDIPFVAVSTSVSDGKLEEMADVHINLQLAKGLLPDDFGNRYGYPSSMAALYVYYGLKFTIDEILAEYE